MPVARGGGPGEFGVEEGEGGEVLLVVRRLLPPAPRVTSPPGHCSSSQRVTVSARGAPSSQVPEPAPPKHFKMFVLGKPSFGFDFGVAFRIWGSDHNFGGHVTWKECWVLRVSMRFTGAGTCRRINRINSAKSMALMSRRSSIPKGRKARPVLRAG
eukprot:1168621-Rhodomonas_salina.2